jgi:hypothetical protein
MRLPFLHGDNSMNPFEIFESTGIYKLAILYFSRSRGLAIVGRSISDETVEVIQISGEVDPHTGNFTALDYMGSERKDPFPVVSRGDFENLVAYIQSRVDRQTRMSIIEPDLIRDAVACGSVQEAGKYRH